MTLVLTLALADLFRDRLALICNVAMICGILVPLMVLQGAKSGVGAYLISELETDPEVLSITSVGNTPLSDTTIEKILEWPGVIFATPSPRAFTEIVTLVKSAPRQLRSTVALSSGSGDPWLGDGVDELPPLGMAITRDLARELALEVGTTVSIVSQLPGRPRQMLIPMQVSAILPADGLRGDTILVNPGVLDKMEAFIDNYALPDFGFPKGRDPATRVVQWEKVRVQAASLHDVARIESRMRIELGLRTQAATSQIEDTLGLITGLNDTIRLIAVVSLSGLVVALAFAFWSSIRAKQVVLAMLSLMGLSLRDLTLFPVIQAVATMVLGLGASLMFYSLTQCLGDSLLGGNLGIEGLLRLGIDGTLWMIALGLLIAAIAALAAAWQGRRTDPATVLRAGG